MSCSLTILALDLTELQKVAGGKDTAWLQRLFAARAERLAEHDEYFRNFPGVTVYTPLAQALMQIVQGEISDALQPRFQFEYAAALLAAELGQRLDVGTLAECSLHLIDEVDALIAQSLSTSARTSGAWPCISAVLSRGSFLDLPLDPVWPLGSGFLRADEVLHAQAAAQACDLSMAATALDFLDCPEDAVEAAADYRDCLSAAAAQGLGLYLHL